MKALFLHQNFPGQFRHLAPGMLRRGDDVRFVTQRGRPDLAGLTKVEYAPHRAVTAGIHPYLVSTEAAVLNGQAVARSCYEMEGQGWRPDVVIGNPGWGETLFIKDVWPDVPLVLMLEFFYRGRGADVGFDPEFDGGPDTILRARIRSGFHLLALEAADRAYAPTMWQKSRFPEPYQDRIAVIHDGIDVDRLAPDATAEVTLPHGVRLSRRDEVLTFVARNLEPYRGFHTFMRSLPSLLAARPDAQVVVVGGDGVSYGSRAPDGATWKEVLLREVGPLSERVHFTGRLAYADFVRLMQVSSVHAYLTYPFVLGWSMLEAMAAGAVVVGSDTPPVREVIRQGENGFLVDFFDAGAWSARLGEALARRNDMDDLRARGRETVKARFALGDCVKRQFALIDGAVSGKP